jgi:hypothetical protein
MDLSPWHLLPTVDREPLSQPLRQVCGDCVWPLLQAKQSLNLQSGLLCQSCPPSIVYAWTLPNCCQENPQRMGRAGWWHPHHIQLLGDWHPPLQGHSSLFLPVLWVLSLGWQEGGSQLSHLLWEQDSSSSASNVPIPHLGSFKNC